MFFSLGLGLLISVIFLCQVQDVKSANGVAYWPVSQLISFILYFVFRILSFFSFWLNLALSLALALALALALVFAQLDFDLTQPNPTQNPKSKPKPKPKPNSTEPNRTEPGRTNGPRILVLTGPKRFQAVCQLSLAALPACLPAGFQ